MNHKLWLIIYESLFMNYRKTYNFVIVSGQGLWKSCLNFFLGPMTILWQVFDVVALESWWQNKVNKLKVDSSEWLRSHIDPRLITIKTFFSWFQIDLE